MLVLSRKKHQAIKIGDFVEVTIVSMKGGRVQIGINAPESIRISRGKVDPDLAALSSDWNAVGVDISEALLKYSRNLLEHGKESEHSQVATENFELANT